MVDIVKREAVARHVTMTVDSFILLVLSAIALYAGMKEVQANTAANIKLVFELVLVRNTVIAQRNIYACSIPDLLIYSGSYS